MTPTTTPTAAHPEPDPHAMSTRTSSSVLASIGLAGIGMLLLAVSSTAQSAPVPNSHVGPNGHVGSGQPAPPPPRGFARNAVQPKQQEPVVPTVVIDQADSTVTVSLGDKKGMPLLDFVKWAQKVTGKRFTYNARELGANPNNLVHFIGDLTMQSDRFEKDFFAFFQTMLYIKGFAVIPRGEGDQELLEIVLMAGPRGREVGSSARYVAPEDLAEYQHQSGVPILTTVPLKHINAQLANNALRPFFASSGRSSAGGSIQIGNVGNKSALLLQGFGPQVYAAAQLLKLVDTPAGKAQVEKQASAGKASTAASRPAKQTQPTRARSHGPRSEGPHTEGAQQVTLVAPKPQDPAHDEDMITFSLSKPEGMELLEFVKWTQEVTGKRFTFNPAELTAGSHTGTKIHLLGEFSFPRKTFKQDFFAFFQTMLYIKGFAIVPRGEGNLEVLEIVMMTGTRGREVTNGARYVAPEDIAQYRNQTGVPILTTVQLQHIDAMRANNALRPFYASTGGANAGSSVQIGNVGNSSALLLQGFGPQVYAATQLLKLVDVPAAESKLVMQVVRLEHKSAPALKSILSDVLPPRGAAGGPSHPASGPMLKVLADDSQDALILSGTQRQVREALDMIARLDVPAKPKSGHANVIYLKHVRAADMAATLNAFLADDFRATMQGPSRGTARTRKTVVTAHPASNSLLVSASGSRWKQLQALIDHLDRPTPKAKPKAGSQGGQKTGLQKTGLHKTGQQEKATSAKAERGFGFTSFGKAVFQDTDADGLPDTRLPDFDNATGPKAKSGSHRPNAKSSIF